MGNDHDERRHRNQGPDGAQHAGSPDQHVAVGKQSGTEGLPAHAAGGRARTNGIYASPRDLWTGDQALSRDDAERTVLAAADIVQHERSRLIASAPPRFQPLLRTLHGALAGHERGKGSAADRLQQLDAAMVALEPAISVYRQTEEGAIWLDEQLMRQVTSIRSSARFDRAMERVDNSIQIGGTTVEMPGDDKPHEQGALLHEQLGKLVPTMQILNEQVLRAAHDGIHHEAQALLGGGGHGHSARTTLSAGTLVELQGLLMALDAYLIMSDEEFRQHLNHVHGFFNGVATYAEFVKAAVEVAGAGLMTSAAYAGALAKQMGNSTAAAACTGLARGAGLFFGNIIAGIEIVHGVVVFFDSSASRQQRIDGAVGASSGMAWFVGRGVAGAGVGAAASSIILATYAELKAVAYLYWEANLGLTSGLMREAFETLQRDGEALAISADKLAKVGMLMAAENDPAMAADLKRVHDVVLAGVASDLDTVISDSGPHALEDRLARFPGSYAVLHEALAPLRRYKGASSEEQISLGARVALERIMWCLRHAGDLIVGSAKRKHLLEIEHDIASREEHPEQD